MKRISVIIPCYNVQERINQCFDSLCNQTIGMEQMELIFVNDASTDETLNYLKTYESRYPDNIIIVNFEENCRQGMARNVGLQYATALYVGYVDADDTIEPDMFEKMIDAIEQYDCDFVQCRWDSVDKEDHYTVTKPWEREGYMNLTEYNTRKEFISIGGRLVSLCDKVFKREFLLRNEIECPIGVSFEDTYFSHMVFVSADSVCCLNDVLYHYYINANGTMQGKKDGYQKDVISVALQFINTCTQRGIRERKREDVEWLFLENIYVYLLWEIMCEYGDQAYDYYCLLKEMIMELDVDYKNNSYCLIKGNEFDCLMLKLLEYNLSKQQFDMLRDNMVKKIGMHN